MSPPVRGLCQAILLLGTVVAATNVALPPISAQPFNASQILDPALASFSIEFSYLTNFGGNLSSPNVLSQELVQRIVDRTGVAPDVRPGGISVYVFLLGGLITASKT